jgi:hypothetical protein
MNAKKKMKTFEALPRHAEEKPVVTAPIKQDNTAPANITETAKPAVKPWKPKQRPNFEIDYAKNIGEFEFLDGRPVAIHKHAVNWVTPLKSDPDNTTLVGVKAGEKPLPLKIAYRDFDMVEGTGQVARPVKP